MRGLFPRVPQFWVKVLARVAVALVVLVVAVVYLHEIAAGRYPIRCQLMAMTGLKCMGCGGQQALQCLLHGNVRDAMSHNCLIIFYPVYLAGLFIRPLYQSRLFVYGGVVIIVGYMVLRNVILR